MLDSPEGVCPGQARFEYPATSVLFSNCLISEGPTDLHLRPSLDRIVQTGWQGQADALLLTLDSLHWQSLWQSGRCHSAARDATARTAAGPDLRRCSTVALGGRVVSYFLSVGCRFESCQGRENRRSEA